MIYEKTLAVIHLSWTEHCYPNHYYYYWWTFTVTCSYEPNKERKRKENPAKNKPPIDD